MPWAILLSVVISAVSCNVFEPGFTYKLLVARRRIANPPADGSSIAWRYTRPGKNPDVSLVRSATLHRRPNRKGVQRFCCTPFLCASV
ncbi:MAG: DUF4377 domain-containing protein [Longimicrobiales bacterium]